MRVRAVKGKKTKVVKGERIVENPRKQGKGDNCNE